MGFATVFASIMFAFIFASMIIFAAVVQKNMTEAANLEYQRDQREAALSDAAISITDSNYVLNGSATWEDDLYADFITGTTSATTIQGTGTVTLTDAGGASPYANGSYTSAIIDTGVAAPTYDEIAWTSVLPAGTSVRFQIRSGDTTAALLAATFVGPNGSDNAYYTVTGTAINSTHSGDRYLQYRANLSTTDNLTTPELQTVSLTIYRNTGVVYINATNSGTVKLPPDATDVYVEGQRITRNDTQRTLALDDRGGQALWDPDETIELHVFRTLSGATQVTVANGAAQDSAVVN